MQVWDLASGKVTQRIANAHEAPIMQLLVYEVRFVQCWAARLSRQPNHVS